MRYQDPPGFEVVTGPAIAAAAAELAALRIAVFRDWPYLYDGDEAYERKYLARYAGTPGAVVVLARDGGRIVGASTGMPLAAELAEFRAPFERAGLDPASVFYFGESVLLPPWRGRGAGHAFFDLREAHARALPGIKTAAFCAVERDAGDPRRPAGYRPLDAFWRGRGYERAAGMTTTFSWRETGEAAESPKRMRFWLKRL
ncbi:MAG: GNAT family acetyltransferase [Flavobacteriaceae bacterium]